jgi:hypothetical protein
MAEVSDPLDKLVTMLTASDVDQGTGLSIIEAGVPYLAGTTLPVAAMPLGMAPGGLLRVTSAAPHILEYTKVYLIADDYWSAADLGCDADAWHERLIAILVGVAPRDEMLCCLGQLGAVLQRPEIIEQLVTGLQGILAPAPYQRLLNSVRFNGRAPLVRQALLGAFREVLVRDQQVGSGITNPLAAALLLTHAVAATFANEPPDAGERIGGFPAPVAVDLSCNLDFNASRDVYAVIDRTLRLWRKYGEVGAKLVSADPAKLLQNATGLEVEDLVAFGFAIWTALDAWEWGTPILVNRDLVPNADPIKWATFLEMVASTPEEAATRVAHPRSEWDYLAFQSRPILNLPNGLLVVDVPYLLGRVMTGLYWDVFDDLRDKGGTEHLTWTQAWGDMVEALVEDSLRPIAPPVLDNSSKTFYTEEDLEVAYPDPGVRRSDALIDFGPTVGAFEIVSGQLTTRSRVDGDPDAFKDDLEKIAYKKLRQLDGTLRAVLANLTHLYGHAVPRPIQPVVVAGGGLPISPVTVNAIAEYCQTKDLFANGLIRRPVVIDLAEVEMLEALHEGGQNPVDLIARWQDGDMAKLSLRNWLLQAFTWTPEQFRPARMRPHVDAAFVDIVARLGLQPDNLPDEPPETKL